MKKAVISALAAVISLNSMAQMVVSDPAAITQSIINTSKTVGESAATRSAVLDNVLETQKIYEQSRKYYECLKKVNTLVKDTYEVKHTVELASEITSYYSDAFTRIGSDPLYSAEELAAISAGYGRILQKCAYALSDLKTFTAGSSLSMTDKERLDVIERCHSKMEHCRKLIEYYTRKVESVASIRRMNGENLDGLVKLYGTVTGIEE